MNNPYGQCQHTKYDGSEPCIHDAYQRGREDAARAIVVEIASHKPDSMPNNYQEGLLDGLDIALGAARGGEPSELEHADDCDIAIGCTCGTRTIAHPQEEQE